MEKEIIKAEDLKKHSEDRHIHSRRNSTNLLFFFSTDKCHFPN